MRLSFKLILWFWLGLILIMCGLFYGAYSRLRPETFIALLNEQAQRSYPGSKILVGNIDYRLSVDINLNLKDIVLTRSGKTLGRVGEVELRVPWWLLLFNRGNAQINLSELTIYLDDETVISKPNSPRSKTIDKKVSVTLPSYLADAHYTLRAKNVNIQDLHSSRRFFTLSKFLVREFQYGKNSAFEMNIPIEIHNKDANYVSELWLFGDVTPQLDNWDLNYRGEFKTKESNDKFQIDDLVIEGKANFNPSKVDFQSNINLLIEKNIVGSGVGVVKNNEAEIHLNFEKVASSYLSLLSNETKNPFLSKLDGDVMGFVKFSRLFDQENSSHLSGKLSFAGEMLLDSKVSFPGKWQMDFEDEKWETSFLSPKGEVSFFRRAFLDFKNSKVTQFVQEVGFEGIDFKAALIPVENLNTFSKLSDGPYFSTLISLKKCTDGERVVDGTFRYGSSPDQKFYQIQLTNDGKIELNFQQKTNNKQMEVTFSKFSWNPSYRFLSPYFDASEGVIDGKLSGRWEQDWMSGEWVIRLKTLDLKSSQGFWPDVHQQLGSYFDVDLGISKEINWNVTIQKNLIKLNSLAIQNGSPLLITGQLNSDAISKSFLVLSHPKNKKLKPIKKDVKEAFWKKEI